MNEKVKYILLQEIIPPLLIWYDTHARMLPWRRNTAPYRIWISEIMLQQTRVEAVIPYYERFLEAFPDVKTLADANEEWLMKLWEGLGYYSRARNLQKAAKVICQEYGGVFPGNHQEILKLPGIGPYTAGAIASIAFELPEPAVDGNVLRVLARLREDEDDIADAVKKKAVTEELRQVYPLAYRQSRCGDLTQSLMELGAVICIPNGEPLCGKCPLGGLCMAKRHGTQREFPVKTKKKERKREQKTVLLLCSGEELAIQKRSPKGLLANLWQLPMIEGALTKEEALRWLQTRGLCIKNLRKAGKKKHVFTHIEWEMTGYLVEIHTNNQVLGTDSASQEAFPLLWITKEELQDTYALPSAFRPFVDFWKRHDHPSAF